MRPNVVCASAMPKSMSARSVCSGMRPCFSDSRRDISAPPRRPATATLMPFAPRCIVRCTVCLIARRNATRRCSCSAMLRATRYASSSGVRISLMFTRTRWPVVFSSSVRSRSTLAPLRPMTMPGFAVWIVTVIWLTLRSISTCEMPASVAPPSMIRLRIAMSSCSCVR